ncbi:MAG: hypothetical protein H7A52_08430 [Akkermansiaceae bacterium]|nr:hypothetical protein [Akkermansiaceae bacterium]
MSDFFRKFHGPSPVGILLGLLATALGADDTFSQPPTAFSTLEPAKGGVHLRAGVAFRTISAGFQVRAPGPLPWRKLVETRSAPGDVGLYRGGSPIAYSDGLAGPDYGVTYGSGFPVNFDPSGDALTIIDSDSQIRSTARIATGLNLPVYEVDFHSEGYAYTNAFRSAGYESAGAETVSGPCASLAIPLAEIGPGAVLGVVGYGFFEASFGTGTRPVAWQSVTETHSRHTYRYDYFGIATDPGTSFPFDGTGRDGGALVYDPDALVVSINDLDGGLLPPREFVTTSEKGVRFFAMSRADLDVDLHEIPLGLEWSCPLGPLRLGCEAGATLNVIDYDLSHRLDWYRAGGGGRAIFSRTDRSCGSPMKVGAYAGLRAMLPLNDSGTLYLEAHGSYRWVDGVRVSAGPASANLDLSSWEGGVGLGIVLD